MHLAETFMGQAFFKEYFDCLTENSSRSPFIADRLEVKHAVNLTSVDGPMSWNISDDGRRRLFKDLDAGWLFFFPFAYHCRSFPNTGSDGTPKITVKL